MKASAEIILQWVLDITTQNVASKTVIIQHVLLYRTIVRVISELYQPEIISVK